MSSGIAFSADRWWLVGRGLSDPVMERVAQRLEGDDRELAEFVRTGIHMQCVSVDLLEPVQREPVRQAVVAVVREILADDEQLRSIDEGASAPPETDPEDKRRQTLQRLLDLAEADDVRRFAAGEPT